MAPPRDAGDSSSGTPILLGLAVAATVVVLPALGARFLTQAGYPGLGSVVWATGYGVGVVLLWYLWIRPLDISAPEGVDRSRDDEPNGE